MFSRMLCMLSWYKSFNCVPHCELLKKLWKMGLVGKSWSLLKDYLSFHIQCVAMDGELSGFAPVTSGVPQGSILGPLVFMYILMTYFAQFPH